MRFLVFSGKNDPKTSTFGAFSHFFLQSAAQHLSVCKCTKFEVSILDQVCVWVYITENACFWTILKENAPKKCQGNISRFGNMVF